MVGIVDTNALLRADLSEESRFLLENGITNSLGHLTAEGVILFQDFILKNNKTEFVAALKATQTPIVVTNTEE